MFKKVILFVLCLQLFSVVAFCNFWGDLADVVIDTIITENNNNNNNSQQNNVNNNSVKYTVKRYDIKERKITYHDYSYNMLENVNKFNVYVLCYYKDKEKNKDFQDFLTPKLINKMKALNMYDGNSKKIFIVNITPKEDCLEFGYNVVEFEDKYIYTYNEFYETHKCATYEDTYNFLATNLSLVISKLKYIPSIKDIYSSSTNSYDNNSYNNNSNNNNNHNYNNNNYNEDKPRYVKCTASGCNNGKKTCQYCGGRKTKQCQSCNGTGKRNKKNLCGTCHGSGRITCGMCHGKGYDHCWVCKGTGRVER